MPDTDEVPSAEIPLGRGLVAIIDAADLPLVANHKWHLQKAHVGDGMYASTNVRGADGKRRPLAMHRLILITDAPYIDHKDNNGLNNRRSNLRPATSAQNMRNRRPQSHSSKFKGVHFNNGRGRSWKAYIKHGGETIHLGSFETEEAAARQYDRAARLLHGEFARTNAMLGLLAA